MQIKQYKLFEFEIQNKSYGLFGNLYYQNPISHVQFFLNDCYGYIQRAGGPVQFFNNLSFNKNGECDTGFNELALSVDINKKLVYISELFFASNYENIMTEEEFNIKYYDAENLELFRNNILDSAVMTKDNFINLLTKWGAIWQSKPPFVLLYQDENNWFDVLPFDSQETMEKFIVDHTKQEATQK